MSVIAESDPANNGRRVSTLVAVHERFVPDPAKTQNCSTVPESTILAMNPEYLVTSVCRARQCVYRDVRPILSVGQAAATFPYPNFARGARSYDPGRFGTAGATSFYPFA